MRIDDALNATKAAVEEGFIPGGGITLYRGIQALQDLQVDGPDQRVGADIVRRALEEPLRQIAHNAGKDGAQVVAWASVESDPKVGYNAKKDKMEDLVEAGVIDPTKVVRSGLQNAASVAGMVLTTEAIVTDFDEEKEKARPEMVII